jgi:hypothetical protein
VRYHPENYSFGHPTYCDDYGDWRFVDSDELAVYESRQRRCPKCRKFRTANGHDPCIANLPGVRNACCGHGMERGYVQFENGTVLRFNNLTVDAKRRERVR